MTNAAMAFACCWIWMLIWISFEPVEMRLRLYYAPGLEKIQEIVRVPMQYRSSYAGAEQRSP
jgi:hypothetical protein